MKKIEQDIASLGKSNLKKLSDCLDEYKADQWDRQTEEDAKARKLDKLAQQALADHRAGRTRLL